MIRNSGRTQRRGFTLTEVLIAMSITLLILLAMMQAFTVASKDISQGRNRLILAERMQTASDLIREDLEQLSLGVEPIVAVDKDLGYFEYVDGPFRDMTFANIPNNSTLGDFDDILAFTVKSQGEPFRGRYTPGGGATTIIESMEAEVIYFTQWTDPTVRPDNRRIDSALAGDGQIGYGDQIRLYRRVLLIRPDMEAVIPAAISSATTSFNNYVDNNYVGNQHDRLLNRSEYAKFLQYNDISLRYNSLTGLFVPNSIGTLSHPANRTAHSPTIFPHPILKNDPRDTVVAPIAASDTYLSDLVLLGPAMGNDVLLENVVGFDVKVFDPGADAYDYGGMVVTAQDPGFEALKTSAASAMPPVIPDRGSYVDLGAIEYRQTAFVGPNAVPNIPDLPLMSYGPNSIPFTAIPASLQGQPYQFAYWDSQRDLSAEPAANYFTSIFSTYIASAGGPTYTTWPDSFEYDQIDNDGDGLFDEGADGIATGTPVPDLFSDKDSAPPYAYPIKSVQVTLRTASFDADRQKISASDQVIQSQVVVSTTNQ